MKYAVVRRESRFVRRARKQILLVIFLFLSIIACIYYWDNSNLYPRDIILRTKASTNSVLRRYILFTTSVDSGEWPQAFNTKDHLLITTNQTQGSIPSQIYTEIPRNNGNRANYVSTDHIFAMATDSTHIFADDFLPKLYLMAGQSTLFLVLGPLDPQELKSVTDHVATSGLKSLVIKVPVDDKEQRKFELLSTLIEFSKYDEGIAKYYTILDDDVFLPSVPTYCSIISQYNSIESHIIADTTLSSDVSYTPITITNAALNRLFADDEIWKKCAEAAKSLESASAKILHCVGVAQGQLSGNPRFDSESLALREVSGSAAGLLESGIPPLSYRPHKINAPPGTNHALFQDLITGIRPVNTSELFGRYTFIEHDEIRWVYVHGLSMTHYPGGISEKQLKMIEVTWNRAPEETMARDAPYYRAELTEEDKITYLLHDVIPHREFLKSEDGKREIVWNSFVYKGPDNDDIQVDWVLSE